MGLRAMSANAAVEPAARTAPAASRRRERRRAPRPTSAGPAATGNQMGKEVSTRSSSPGKRSPNACWPVGSKTLPVGAASWWARTTSVRAPSGSPQEATTFWVVAGRMVRRRKSRGPLEMSSAMPAEAATPSAVAARRAPASASAPATRPSAVICASAGANSAKASSSSTVTEQPSSSRRRAIHAAASASPGEQGGRSMGASAAIVAARSSRSTRSIGCSGTARGYRRCSSVPPT